MIINVHVQGRQYPVQCTRGDQLVRWLGYVACQRHTMEMGHLHVRQFVPKGVLLKDGTVLDPQKKITDAISEGLDVWVEVGEDAQAYSLRWEGRPETPPFEVEIIRRHEEEELETLALEDGRNHVWLRNFDFKRYGIEKMLLMDLKKLSDEDFTTLSKSYQTLMDDSNALTLKAAKDYVATKHDGLSFKKGDMIQIIDNSDPYTWKGSLNGKMGNFPAQFLELEQVIANREFTGSKSEELAFKKGDILSILDKNDPNWWRGLIGAKVGVFPRTFVSKLPKNENGELDSGTKFIAVKDVAYSTDELQLRKGDIVAVLDMGQPDVWKGACNGNVGSFPSNAVTVLQDPAVSSVVAKREYTANKVGELTFKRGDRILLVEGHMRDRSQDDDSQSQSTIMWKGMLNGNVGLFPAHYVYKEQMTAVQNHPSKNDEELAFEAGQVITILDRSDPERYKGELNGDVGTFAARFVTRSHSCLATRDYKATRPGELNVRKGELITILEKIPEKSDAEFVRVNIDQKIGLIPRSYIPLLQPTDETKVIAVRDHEASTDREISFSKYDIVTLVDAKDPQHWKGFVGASDPGFFARSAVEPLLGQQEFQTKNKAAPTKASAIITKEHVADIEQKLVREILLQHASFLRNVYSYYSAVNTVGYVDVTTMNSSQFQALVRDCHLMSPTLRPADIDIIFVAAQFKHGKVTSTGSAPRALGDSEKVLNLQEFVAALIRLANAKHRPIPRLSERVRQLIVTDLTPNAMPLLFQTATRLRVVHKPDVRSVLDKHRKLLNILFDEVVNEAKGKVTFAEFCKMIKNLGLLGDISVFNVRCIFMYVTSSNVDIGPSVELQDVSFELDSDQFSLAMGMCGRVVALLPNNPDPDAPFPAFLDSFLSKISLEDAGYGRGGGD